MNDAPTSIAFEGSSVPGGIDIPAFYRPVILRNLNADRVPRRGGFRRDVAGPNVGSAAKQCGEIDAALTVDAAGGRGATANGAKVLQVRIRARRGNNHVAAADRV